MNGPAIRSLPSAAFRPLLCSVAEPRRDDSTVRKILRGLGLGLPEGSARDREQVEQEFCSVNSGETTFS
jgi:hypothetical protein